MNNETLKDKQARKKFEKDLEKNIRVHGYSIVTLESKAKGFYTGYTIGLAEKGFSDICCNVPSTLADNLSLWLSYVADKVLAKDFVLADMAKLDEISPAKPKLRFHLLTDPTIITEQVSPHIIKRYGDRCRNMGPLKLYQMELGDNLGRFGGDEGFVPFIPFIPFTDRLKDIYQGYIDGKY